MGIVKPESWLDGAFVKRRCGDGRLEAEVREIRERRVVERCMVLVGVMIVIDFEATKESGQYCMALN